MKAVLARAALALGLLPASIVAHAATVLWIQGAASSPYAGQTIVHQVPTANVAILDASSSSIYITFTTGSSSATVRMGAAAGATLSPGAFESTVPASTALTSVPRLDFSTSGSSWCSVTGGRFAVLESVMDSNFQIARFAANFEATCSNYAGPVYGELRIDSSIPLTNAEAPGSITPDPFAFPGQMQLRAGETAESNFTTIYGINAGAPVSVANGEYSINGNAWTTMPGSVGNRDRVKVRGVAPATPGHTVEVALTVGGVNSSFPLRTYVAGEPLTAVVMRRAAGTYSAAINIDGRGPSWVLTPQRPSDDQVSIRVRGPAYSYEETFSFRTARAAPMATGPYELASWAPMGAVVPDVRVPNCYPEIGRFVVLEYEPGTGTAVNRFAADFDLVCGDANDPPLFGEIRVNSAIPTTNLKPAGSTMPHPYALLAQMPVRAGAIVNSHWISLLGVNAPMPISVTGGEYSVNGGPFTSDVGTVQPEDAVIVRGVASRVPGGTRRVTLKTGGRAVDFDITTYSPATPLSGIYFRSTAGDYIGAGQTRLHLAPFNTFQASAQYNNGRQFSVNTVIDTYWTLNLAPPNSAPLAVGAYENATRWPFQAAGTPGLDFSGSGRGCNQLGGRFVVREVLYNGADLVKLAADFEQRCENSSFPLFGEVRFNSTVPFSALEGGTLISAMDLDGSGKSDILYRNDANGTVYRLLMDGLAVAGGAVAHRENDLDWSVVGEGDFDGNGVSDLLWRHAATGQVYVMRFAPNGLPEGGAVAHVEGDPNWKIAHTPDLDGDGRSDILWWNSSTGTVWAMLMNGHAIVAQGVVYTEPNTAWRIAAVGDFTASGKRNQLVWRNAVDGRVFLMTVNRSGGAFTTSGQMIYTEPNPSWRIVAAADANGDGRSDLYWRNESTGQVYLMLMSGGTITSAGHVYVEPNLAWQVAAIGDYDGNGRADILYRNEATGQVFMLLMDSFSIAARGMVYHEPDVAWRIVAPPIGED